MLDLAPTAKARAADKLCWSGRVTPHFRAGVVRVSDRLGIDPNDLMACMAFETGRTFSPSEPNGAGSGAVGLIQFMPSTATALGTSTEALAAMGALAQLAYVEAYFKPYKGRLKNLGDVYMAILWPGGIGRPDDWVMFRRDDPKAPRLYIQNAGLDYNHDGAITRGEAVARVAAMKAEGLKPENMA